MPATNTVACMLLLSLCAIVFALPPLNLPNDGLIISRLQQYNSTSQPLAVLNSTSTSPVMKTTCYEKGHRSPTVDTLLCFNIIETLVRTRNYDKPRRWKLNNEMAIHMKVGACRLQILDGAASDVFSMSDVVDTMETILEECQPEVKSEYGGTGGQRPVGRYGFTVRVVGVKGIDRQQ